MKKRVYIIFTVFLALLFAGHAWCKRADLAGLWYSSSPSALKAELQRYLDNAAIGKIDGEAVGFLAPHAGFRFSGPVAAYAFKAAAAEDPDTVIVVGFSHRRVFSDIAVFTDEMFVTPLGSAYTEKRLSQKLIDYHKRIRDFPRAFEGENSVEMEIPFIQLAMKDARIVLVAIGDQSLENVRLLADALYDVLKDEKDYVIIGSTDMSHYLLYKDAAAKDKRTIESIKRFKPDMLYAESLENRHELMCGYGTACAVMLACEKLGANEVRILKYANSGDTSGMKDRVVGYLSAAFVRRGNRRENKGEEEETAMLNRDQRETLLRIARNTINHYLKTGKRLDVGVEDDVLKQDMGAFVTLHKNGQLRGCIGHMVATGPLYLTVRDMAIAAAAEDPRFPPVTMDEMDEIDIEISALSPMEKITDYEKIEVGKHGVMVRMGWKSGVYLPQVAAETGWNREEFLTSLCDHKAGIPPDAWKTGACEMSIFTAEVFGEKDHE